MNILLITSNSITIELENKDLYKTKAYDIYLNDSLIGKNTLNVISLYDLLPNTLYKLKINDDEITFKTLDLIMKKYNPVFNELETSNLQNELNNLLPNEVLEIDDKINVVSLFLNDNNKIYLSKNAYLLGEIDRTKYPILKGDEYLNGYPLGTWEGRSDDSFSSIITILGKKNVLVYGPGVVDCNAQNSDFWVNHRVKRIARRPKGIFIHSSNNVIFEGFTVCNSPSWNQHPFFSNNLKYINMTIFSPKESPTTDGIDPEACNNVLIVGNRITSGDDCIAIKSNKIELAKKYNTPSSNIEIRNNLMETGHAGVTIGSEMSGGINNIKVNKCIFKNTDRGLRIKTQRGRGNNPIKDVIFDNILMDNVLSPFVINAFYKAGNDEVDYRYIRTPLEKTELTPILGKFTFSNIKCDNVSYGLGCFLGLPESMIEEVCLNNIDVSFNKSAEPGIMAMTDKKEMYKNVGIVASNVKKISINNVNYKNSYSEEFILDNVLEIYR